MGHDNASGLAWFKLEHATSERMAFNFTTELKYRRLPNRHDATECDACFDLHGVDAVGAARAGIVTNQTDVATGHICEEKIWDAHVGDGVPRVAHAALVGPPSFFRGLRIQIPFEASSERCVLVQA